MARTIARTIEIDCTPEQVWAVLTDFAAHPVWNPFIREITGQPVVGTRLRVHISPPGGRGMVFRPVVTAAEPGRAFAWLGKLFVRGVFDGEHSFTLRDLGAGRTALTQAETFRGLLVPLLSGSLDTTANGFQLMNQALKERCESGADDRGADDGGADESASRQPSNPGERDES